MRTRITLATTLSLFLGLLPAGGCMTAMRANNAVHMTAGRATAPRVAKRFRVLDAETRAPVPRAWLVVVHDFDWMGDWEMNGTTDSAGVATFRVAKDYLHLLHVGVGADGYLMRDHLTLGGTGGGGGGGGGTPGVGRISDDPVDVYIYKAPGPTVGLRVPAGYRGPVVVLSGPQKYDFPFPPDFPAGQRVWWTDVKPGAETVAEQPPPLGLDPAGANPFRIMDSAGRPIPMPDPGAEFAGVAYWRIGTLTPNGPWGGGQPVTLIGERDEALAVARQVWEQHGNGPAGYVLNGWLRVVSPRTKLANSGPDGVTLLGRRR